MSATDREWVPRLLAGALFLWLTRTLGQEGINSLFGGIIAFFCVLLFFLVILIPLVITLFEILFATVEWGSVAYKKGDYSTAQRIFRMLAMRGDPTAQFYYGLLFEKAHGVSKDDKIAAEWYQKAAEQGRAEAQFNLGVMYGTGTGLPHDHAEAYFWLNLVASQNSDYTARAVISRDLFASMLTPQKREEIQARCTKWLEKIEVRKAAEGK